MCNNVGSIYIEYSRHVVGPIAGIFLGPSAHKVKCMYTSVSGHIVDCREFIRGIYIRNMEI